MSSYRGKISNNCSARWWHQKTNARRENLTRDFIIYEKSTIFLTSGNHINSSQSRPRQPHSKKKHICSIAISHFRQRHPSPNQLSILYTKPRISVSSEYHIKVVRTFSSQIINILRTTNLKPCILPSNNHQKEVGSLASEKITWWCVGTTSERQLTGRHLGERRVSLRYVMKQLTLDVAHESTGSNAKQVRLQPGVAQFLLHQELPEEAILRRSDATGWVEANLEHRRVGGLVSKSEGVSGWWPVEWQFALCYQPSTTLSPQQHHSIFPLRSYLFLQKP